MLKRVGRGREEEEREEGRIDESGIHERQNLIYEGIPEWRNEKK